MLPEFELDYDYKQARKDFNNNELKNLALISKEAKEEAYKEWFNLNKNKNKYKTVLKKIKYKYGDDEDSAPKNQSREARNNAIIDIMRAILTHPDTIDKILNPGGFDDPKKAARVIMILQNTSADELRTQFSGIGNMRDMTEFLFRKNLDELDEIANKYKRNINPLSPSTFVYFHQQNMNGGKLIGIYANHNANHAVIQHTELAVNTTFTLNDNISLPKNKEGIVDYSLHSMKNGRGQYISRNNAGFLAASVDNVKDPVLYWLLQTPDTADITMTLSRLGYTPFEIGLFLNQPIIKKAFSIYTKEKKNGIKLNDVLDKLINEYYRKRIDTSLNKFIPFTLTIGNLGECINFEKQYDNYNSINQTERKEKDTENFYKYCGIQENAARQLKLIATVADDLVSLLRIMRSDTQGGASGPTIADTELNLQKLREFKDRQASKKFTLIGEKGIIFNTSWNENIEDVGIDSSKDALRDFINTSQLPSMEAFYLLGLHLGSGLMATYFPQLSPIFRRIVATVTARSAKDKLDAKTLNTLYNSFIAFTFTSESLEFFGKDDKLTAREKRDYFIHKFPKEFNRLKKAYKDDFKNNFLKRLKVYNDYKTGILYIGFKESGKLTANLRDLYMRDWESLLYSENPEMQHLALNLFRYNFYKNGLAFGSETFSHLAPIAIRKVIPGYITHLRRLTDNTYTSTLNDDYTFNNFIEQFFRNNLNNRVLIKNIDKSLSDLFIKSNKNNKVYSKDIVTVEELQSNIKHFKKNKEELYNYITVNINGTYLHYKFNNEKDRYEYVNPLGIPYKYVEYENTTENVISVIEGQSYEISEESYDTNNDNSTLTSEEKSDDSKTKEHITDYNKNPEDNTCTNPK